jgi:creatinine amidohydrolase
VDAHAGFTETSLMLHLRPWAVRSDLAEAGNTRPIADLLPELLAGGVGAVSPNGVLGDPAGASADEGQRLLHLMAADIAAAVCDGEPDRHGRLRPVGAVR